MLCSPARIQRAEHGGEGASAVCGAPPLLVPAGRAPRAWLVAAMRLLALAAALRESSVTHMFYECAYAGGWKEEWRAIIAANRSTHGRWRLSADAEQNAVVFAAMSIMPYF